MQPLLALLLSLAPHGLLSLVHAEASAFWTSRGFGMSKGKPSELNEPRAKRSGDTGHAYLKR